MKERLANIRKQLHLDQKAAAERFGVDLETYRAWESGAATIPDESLDRICESSHVNRAWLEKGEGKKYIPVSLVFEKYEEGLAKVLREAFAPSSADPSLSLVVVNRQWEDLVCADEEDCES